MRIALIAVDRPSGLPGDIIYVAWRNLYAWFRRQLTASFWAGQLIEYMQDYETRMIARDYAIRGTITMFDGIHFDDDNPYTYAEGKRLVRLLGDELQGRKDLQSLGVDPKGMRRSAITGQGGDGVWDFLPLKVASNAKQFTAYPHLTMNISRERTLASVTVPNGIAVGFRSKLREAGRDGFMDFLEQVEKGLRSVIRSFKGSKPMAYALQRHSASQRSHGEMDPRTDIDLRTIASPGSGGVKYQPEWAEAIYASLTHKSSNIQFGVSVWFDYACPKIRSPKAVDLFARGWIAMSPLLKCVLD